MVICFVGNPLSGKTTLSRRLAEEFGYAYLSTGDVARAVGMRVDEDSIRKEDLSREFDREIVESVHEFVLTNDKVILDGFPRSKHQVKALKSWPVCFIVLFLNADPVAVLERAAMRKRPGDDIAVVTDRFKSSILLKDELARRCQLCTYTVEEEEKAMEFLRKFMKGVEYAASDRKDY